MNGIMIDKQTLDMYTKNNYCKFFSIQSFESGDIAKEIHRHDFFQIILLRKGSMKHWIDFEEHEVHAPYVSVIFPNQLHRMEVTDGAKIDVIMFDEIIFCSAMLSNELKEYNYDLQSRLNNIDNIPVCEWNEIQNFIGSIQKLSGEMNMIRKMEIKFMIKIILLKIIDMAPMGYKVGNMDADIQIYQKFRACVDEEYMQQKKVTYYAEKLGVSSKKLTAVCYKYTGRSPLEIIHDKLSMELKKAFVEDGLLLKEIAFRFGFSSQSALNKFIQRHFGCTPQIWRSNLEKNMMGKIQ